ncbi:Uncharacterized protein APZ42_014944 [Daphnia magna]|uniref:Uncharacterized protein n=1 Tax=Daphnia magna TaxID=35525 RepID=A0A162P1X5_9CRUS|nr:Uncharacterized protein APZ42_014944 [Daphnia magna]
MKILFLLYVFAISVLIAAAQKSNINNNLADLDTAEAIPYGNTGRYRRPPYRGGPPSHFRVTG